MSSGTDTQVARDAVASRLSAINIGVGAMAVVFVILRFLARWRRRVHLGVDDYLIAASLVFLVGSLTNIEIAIQNGLGLDSADVDDRQCRIVSKCLFSYQFVYMLNISIVKIAILATYQRVFNHRRFNIATYVMSAVICIWCITFCFLEAFACLPVSMNWETSVEATCLNIQAVFFGNAILNIIIDLVILLMPVREVWKLQMRLFQRVSLTALFLLGGFVVFTSSYRMSTLFNIDVNNPTNTGAPVLIWSHIEICAAVVSACLPVLRPLVELLFFKTGFRSKAPSQSLQNALKSSVSPTASYVGDHGVRSRALQSLDTRDVWPPVTNVSSDEVPLRSIKVHTEIEQYRHGSSENSA